MNALAIFKGGVWVHESPALSAPSKFMTTVPDAAALVGLSQIPDADGYRWLHIQFDDGRGEGYVREDVTYVVGDISLWHGGKLADPAIARTAIPGASSMQNLHNAPAPVNPPASAPASPPASAAKWAAPLTGYTITEPYGGPSGHLGVDLAAPLGTPVYNRGIGVVFSADDCPDCPGGAGSMLGTSNPRTNYGFGINVVVKHAYVDLPTSAQRAMDAAGCTGGWLYVRYAHLQKRFVGPGKALKDGDQIGWEGTSGNSSGPHCHVECRASLLAASPNVFNEKLIDPGAVFAI